MRIKTKETFEQTHQKHIADSNSFGTVDYLQFKKNQVYEFYIVPKVESIDLEADECEIDYPFEELNTHFGAYDFIKNRTGQRAFRVNCTGCAICKWMEETRLPKSMFKIAVPTKFFLAYVIHDKKIKISWFQDYLYSILMERISELMSKKDINLIDAFRHRVKLFTNPEGKFDLEINQEVAIPTESQGFKNILVAVNQKPLIKLIQQQLVCDDESINFVLDQMKQYNAEIVKAEKDRERNERMEQESEKFKASIELIKGTSGTNKPFVEAESVGPMADEPDDDLPF
jgi:hypothetical protein